MPQVEVVFFKEENESVPLLEWLNRQSEEMKHKSFVGLTRLQELGHELRRPHADYLRDGIYELRISVRRVQARLLYFFSGQGVVVICKGIIKEDKVPPREIDLAVLRKVMFLADPVSHSFHLRVLRNE